MKKLTVLFLKKHQACEDGYKYAIDNLIGLPADKVINNLIETKHGDWANWYIVRLMTHKQRIMYAIFAAEQTLSNYEKKYPDDNRPRKAIEAAREYLNHPTKKNKTAARSAADSAARSAAYSARSAAHSARSAAYSAYSADLAADSAAYSAAYSACLAAYSAAYSACLAADSAAYSAAYSAYSADSAAYSAYSADSAMLNKILQYGLTLLTP